MTLTGRLELEATVLHRPCGQVDVEPFGACADCPEAAADRRLAA